MERNNCFFKCGTGVIDKYCYKSGEFNTRLCIRIKFDMISMSMERELSDY